ncbi:MAG: glycosyltransferase [Acidimicrobiales bacterium]
MPAYEEGEAVVAAIERVLGAVNTPCELLVVYDSPEDSTAKFLTRHAEGEPRLRPMLSTYGRGPARAIRFGFDRCRGDVVVVTMADGSDDPHQIDQLTHLIERGVAVAAASRYMPGGRLVGGPRLKGLISRLAGLSLNWLAGVGTRDATNSFKAYSRQFVEDVGITSDAGFEVGIELVAKARRLRLPVAEIPTIWLDRVSGQSNFALRQWLGRYLRWYFFAFGPRLTAERVRAATASGERMA